MLMEKNFSKKNPLDVDIRTALVYPNEYKVAMSNLGYQIIYNILNDREDTYCERFIYPYLRSLETGSPLSDFNIIAFSLQYEEDYFNMVKILNDSNIPLNKEDRLKGKHPLIIAGGPCASSNPSVISDFIDIFIIGDGENILNELFNNIHEDYDELAKIPGVYIPSINNKVKLQVVNDLNNAYTCKYPILIESDDEEFETIFKDSIMLNISRGCSRGCRFCMSTYLYRPKREAKKETLIKYCKQIREKFKLNKVTLIGAAVSDYTKINELINELENEGFQVSVPSMRIESITENTLIKLKKTGLKTLTIAPETIPLLRKRINKEIPDNIIFNLIKKATGLGFNIKYYFLIGIPNETQEDIENLVKYIKKIDQMKKNNNAKMSFSINPVIPKPHTPLQWIKYDFKTNKKKIKYMKKELKNINVKFSSARLGLIQYILSCGDKNVGKLIEKTIQKKVSTKEWIETIPEYNLEDKLPWDNINVQVNKKFLKKEYEKLLNNQTTPWCEKNGCYNCGACTIEKN